MDGIIIIDKPAGWTSHDVVAKLRGTLKVKRVGHGGTLDPMATGVLPIFVGYATRAVEFCESADKEYIAGLRLGLTTDTQDITGNTLSSHDVFISTHDFEAIIPRFLGAQKQIPPMYSAVKIGGKKLYDLARRGIEIEREARDICIFGIEVLEGGGSEYLLKVCCSKGTYIRTLCNDIGTALGCGGAMSSLRRTRAGAFTVEKAHTLENALEAISSGDTEKIMIPVDAVFEAYPDLTLSDSDVRKCKTGVALKSESIPEGMYRFYAPDGEFLLFGEVKDGIVKVKKRFFGNEK